MSKQYCYEFYVPTKKRVGEKLIVLDLSILDDLFNQYFPSYSIRSETGIYGGNSFETLVYYVYCNGEMDEDIIQKIFKMIKHDFSQETVLFVKKEVEFEIL
ncbi:MAG: hypothetical protein Q4Q19_05265 [Methanobrevibacter sp.]|nr:hypothetical protein [Methanobrevibacter sp.]